MDNAKQEPLAADEAQHAGLVPAGHVWDEHSQQPVPLGEAVLADRLARPMDLEANLKQFERNRSTLLRFMREYLVEAEYEGDRFKVPVPGKMHDFYQVPGSTTKALTKLGAEKLGHLFRYHRGEVTPITESTAEHVSATVTVVLVDHYGRRVGAASASCSTAEAGFQSVRARKKYGARFEKNAKGETEVSPPDYRAALNDIIARAGKRAFVQAMIVACASDEVFTSGEAPTVNVVEEEAEGPTERVAVAFPEDEKMVPASPTDVQASFKRLYERGVRKAGFEKFYQKATGREFDGTVYEADLALLDAAAPKK